MHEMNPNLPQPRHRIPKVGKGLQKFDRLKKAVKSGRSRFNFSSKSGSGPANWGADVEEARFLGYDDEEVNFDGPVDSTAEYNSIKSHINYNFGDQDVKVKNRTTLKRTVVQPEQHLNPEKQYAMNWLDAEEISALH